MNQKKLFLEIANSTIHNLDPVPQATMQVSNMAPTRKQIKTSQRKKDNKRSKYFTKERHKNPKQTRNRLDGQNDETKESKFTDIISLEQANDTIQCPLVDVINPSVFTKRLSSEFFDKPAETLAVALLGKLLCRVTQSGEKVCGKIVETEAYLGEVDPACHSYGGRRTARNEAMYAAPGTSYVYFIYGMYHCFNISSKESGACVLIRALEPVQGLDGMRKFRSEKRKQTSKLLKDHELANGPSKLCTAMDISKDNLNNTDLVKSVKFWVEDTLALETFTVVHTTRIGIESYGEESALKPYRYYILGNKNVSVRDRNSEEKLSS